MTVCISVFLNHIYQHGEGTSVIHIWASRFSEKTRFSIQPSGDNEIISLCFGLCGSVCCNGVSSFLIEFLYHNLSGNTETAPQLWSEGHNSLMMSSDTVTEGRTHTEANMHAHTNLSYLSVLALHTEFSGNCLIYLFILISAAVLKMFLLSTHVQLWSEV